MREVFVFGSNLAGRHGLGAALHAKRHHGAVYGQGIGLQGNSYAIPTKNRELKVLAVSTIAYHVDQFLKVARACPKLQFNITRIGCGLSGYDWDTQIRPLFPVELPTNCKFI